MKGRNGDRLPDAIEDMTKSMAGPLSGEVWRSRYRSTATRWDFVNIFTEAAQHLGSLAKQLRVEERAGRLAELLAQT